MYDKEFELLDKIDSYCEESFPLPKDDYPEDIKNSMRSRNYASYIIMMLLLDSRSLIDTYYVLTKKDLKRIVNEFLTNVNMYKLTNNPQYNYYGIDVNDADDYMATAEAIIRFIDSIEYQRRKRQ